MDNDPFVRLRHEIMHDSANRVFTELGYEPLFTGSVSAKIVVIGQAPGIKAQMSGMPWNDASGLRLMQWLGVSEAQFHDDRIIAHMPMDFYYPGKGKTGDLPPRKDFSKRWHQRVLKLMPDIELILLVGSHAQNYYLQERKKTNLTATVRSYSEYLPGTFPLVHPSPLNFRWFKQNTWFEAEVVPVLRQTIDTIFTNNLNINDNNGMSS
jgi:uracil-DNA glycosylase